MPASRLLFPAHSPVPYQMLTKPFGIYLCIFVRITAMDEHSVPHIDSDVCDAVRFRDHTITISVIGSFKKDPLVCDVCNTVMEYDYGFT